MELGITIPLQKYLKKKTPPYGTETDLFFCWELHIISFHGKDSLLAVNASNRFTIVLWNLTGKHWDNLFIEMERGIRLGFQSEGYQEQEIDCYLSLAGHQMTITKTHGRKPVASLNRAVEFLLHLPMEVEKEKRYQAHYSQAINRARCKAAGFETHGYSVDYLEQDMKRLEILSHLST